MPNDAYWPPMTQLAGTTDRRTLIVRGRGSLVWDAAGTEYVDATAGLWYANVGHGRPEIGAAVAEQMGRLAAYSNFGDFATGPTIELADRIAGLAEIPDAKVFLTSGGSDAVDSAVKIARRYWSLLGRPDKTVVIGRRGSYHGMHGFGTDLGGIPANRDGYGLRQDEDFRHVGAGDLVELAAVVDRTGADRIAAVVAEPVMGAGGVIPPPPGYLTALQQFCRDRDLLFVADEVVTGFGRLGRWFAAQHYRISPDLLLFAKGVTSGYAPLGGVVASRRVWEPFADSVFRHGYTYSGHAACCAAALANLDILEAESLPDRVAAVADQFAAVIGQLAGNPQVTGVRTAGLLAGVQLAGDPPGLSAAVVAEARRRGVLTRALADGSLQVSPPFVVSPGELERIVEVFDAAIGAAADRAVRSA